MSPSSFADSLVEVYPLANVPDEPVESFQEPIPCDGTARHYGSVPRARLYGLQLEDLGDLLERERPLYVLLVRENQEARPGQLRRGRRQDGGGGISAGCSWPRRE